MAYSGSYHPERAEQTEQADRTPAPPPAGEGREGARPQHGRAPFDLGSLFQKAEAVGMETDDLLLALILYLMYRESGDRDLLVMLGAILLT